MLELMVFEFHGSLEPVLAVQVHHDAALVEALVALGEIGFHDKTEVLLLRLDLEYRGVVIAEMIVCPLPEVRVWGRGDRQRLAVDGEGGRFAGPLKCVQVDIPAIFQGSRHPVDKVGRGRRRGRVSAGKQTETKAGECEGVGRFHHIV